MFLPLCLNPTLIAALLLILLKDDLKRKEISYCGFYTALGDSIAYGLGAPNRYGYVYQFRDYLRTRYSNVILKNVSKPGITSSGLLQKLRLSSSTRFAVKNAELITISIGGNNLLKSGRQNYSRIDSSVAHAQVSRFASDWPAILSCIRNNIGSRAPILVMTLYNPYKCDDPMYLTASYFINEINSIIRNVSLQKFYGYSVVEVHEYFESNYSKDWVHFNQYNRNPHPTAEGHRQIFLLHKNIIES